MYVCNNEVLVCRMCVGFLICAQIIRRRETDAEKCPFLPSKNVVDKGESVEFP